MPRLIAAAALVALTLAGIACKARTDGYCCLTPSVCSANGGDGVVTPCADPAAPFCDEQGTYPASHGVGRQCIPDPNQSECNGPQDCTMAGYPYCVAKQCRQCDGAGMGCVASAPVCSQDYSCVACASEDQCAPFAAAGQGHCGTSGACVGCRDGGDCADAAKPVCGSDMTCRACAADSECASNACDQDSGQCEPEANVIYVAPGGTGSGTCTKAQPCNSFALAVAQVTSTRNVIKAAPGSYTGQVALNGTNVSILGVGATVQPAALNQSVVVISNGADVTITGLTISGAGGASNPQGVVCSPNGGGTPTLRLRRTKVAQNVGGGLSITGCNYSVTNTFVVDNGSATSTVGGVQIANVGTAGQHEFLFNTIASNIGAAGGDTGVACVAVATPLVFADSIVFANQVSSGGKQVNGNNCAWSYSDIGDAVTGTGNITGDPQFVDTSGADFHIKPTSPAKDMADPAATVKIDYDGDARPSGPHSDMGADEAQ